MKITARARLSNNQWSHDQSTGFLRCRVVVLNSSVLPYRRAEIGEQAIPPELAGVELLRVYFPPEAIADAEALRSLEGMPAVYPAHTWQTVADDTGRCGAIAGAPLVVDGGMSLMGDIVVTDPRAVQRIMMPDGSPDLLREISSAYDCDVTWTPGVSPSGEAYDGIAKNLRYNHVALLPPGNGRGGATVRIINHRGKTMDYITFRGKRTGRNIRVMNEDADAFQAEEAATDKLVDPSDIEAITARLTDLNTQIETLAKEKAELEGQVQAFKDQLDAALSPDTVEAAAAEMNEERTDAVSVANSFGVKVEPAKLRGTALKASVVNAVRLKNSKPVLTAEETANEGYVRGLYDGLKQIAGRAPAQAPTGHGVVMMNAAQGQVMMTPADMQEAHKQRLYGAAK